MEGGEGKGTSFFSSSGFASGFAMGLRMARNELGCLTGDATALGCSGVVGFAAAAGLACDSADSFAGVLAEEEVTVVALTACSAAGTGAFDGVTGSFCGSFMGDSFPCTGLDSLT